MRILLVLLAAAFALFSGPSVAQVSILDPTVTQITTGDSHSCALTTRGGVMCWGSNGAGQLGDNSTSQRLAPTDVPTLASGIAQIAAGATHTCALTGSGGVQCWGSNTNGQLGDNSSTTRLAPVDVSGLTSGVAAIAAGFAHTCALTAAGGVKCWGRNDLGQLGDATNTQRLVPVNVSGLTSGVVAIAAGGLHTCAITTAGGLKCWGNNASGQLGDNTTTTRSTPFNVFGLTSGVTNLAAGNTHTCAIVTGAAKCWGDNGFGQLGDNSTTQRLIAVNVVGMTSGVTSISADNGYTCAVVSGAAKCWGLNSNSQLGDNSTTQRLTPSDVVGMSTGTASISAGPAHACATTTQGALKCWGNNTNGRIGDNSTTSRPAPVNVAGLGRGVGNNLAAGRSHSCALSSGGGVTCWGTNIGGQLGDGTTTNRLAPVAVKGLASGVVALAARAGHTCALTLGGGVKCWGNNFDGELGDGTTTSSPIPVDVVGLSSGVMEIAVGERHTCARTIGGGMKCWGDNADGQIGDNSTTSRLTPVDVQGLNNSVLAISAGASHTCALVSGGALKCWGNNGNGQLGDNSTTRHITPVTVPSLANGVVAVTTGNRHTCAIVTGGGVKCWGSNDFGQLGDNSTVDRHVPGDVPGMSSGVAVIAAAGGYVDDGGHTCALTTAGGLKCWGKTYSHSVWILFVNAPFYFGGLVPVDVSGLTSGVTAMAVGANHACAFTSAGSLKCWDNNAQGQLGDGTTNNHGNPEYVLNAQSISFTPPSVLTAGTATSLAASATSTGTVAFDTWTPSICSVTGSIFSGYSVTALSIGLCGIRASQSCNKSVFGCPTDGSFADGPQQLRLIPVLPDTQTITFGAPPSVGLAGQTRTVSATASSGLVVTFTTLTPANCTVAGNLVSLLTGGTSCTIAANQAGNASFSAAPQVTQGFFIALMSQAITFNALPNKTFGDLPFAVAASSSSGLAVTLTSTTTSVCFMAASSAVIVSTGMCTIVASQNGNAMFGAATAQTQSFQVAKANQSINFGAIGTKFATQPPFAISAMASSSLPVIFTTSGTCIVSGNTLTLTGPGGCSAHADQAGNGNYNPAPQVTRSFNVLPAFTLSVAKAGGGTGSVFSDSGFINCGATCSDGYGSGVVVTLGMIPGAGSNFAGWSGACSGLGTCIVTMDAAKSVTATFQPATVTLTVNKAGAGSGNLLSAPTGIDCGAGCAAAFNFNASVTLLPTPSLGSQFTGWSGACAGSGACVVTMDAAKTVTATFALASNAPSTTTMAFVSPTVPCGIDAPYTATVSGAFGTPTGTVTLRLADGTPTGTYPLLGGVRSSSFSFTGYNGVTTYYVEYNGNSTYATSQSPMANLNVIKATPAVALVSGNNPSLGGSNVILTATVTRVGVCVIPSGTVTFKDGAATIGSVPLDAAGVATLSTSSLSGGSHSLTAEYSGANYYLPVTSAAITQTVETSLALVAVQSRKAHGAAGIFDLNIDTTQPINGAVTVEPRTIGSGFTMVFQFDGPVSVPGSVSVTPVGTASAAFSGNDVLVMLTNVPDNQRVTVSLVNVNGSVSPPPVSVGFLVGDVNNTRSVNSSDISGVKARSGQTTDGTNFKFDLNATGSINSSDISAVKARSGLTLP